MEKSSILDTFLQFNKVSTDTRNIVPNSIFFALKGDSFNGNTFAKQALEKGASMVVIDEDNASINASQKIVVADVLEALQQLARDYRQTLSCTVVGLTGSNGKTTCKELFRDVLATTYKTYATKGNLNNHIGVPLTILAIPADAEMAVVEMGANHQKEIEFLCGIAQPDWGYITNYGKAHLEGFGGVAGVIKGKSELYDYLKINNKQAFVHEDDALQMEKSAGLRRVTFGQNTHADVVVMPVYGEMAAVTTAYETIQSQLTGDFQCTNIAAAVALGETMDVPLEAIKEAIEGYVPQMNRTEWRKTDKNEVLLDAYNANPDSTAASIIAFAKSSKPNKWYVLGDMFELGDYALAEHQKIVDMLETLGVENAVLVGSHYHNTQTDYLQKETTADAFAHLSALELRGCTVLLKGSRGMKLETLLAVL